MPHRFDQEQELQNGKLAWKGRAAVKGVLESLLKDLLDWWQFMSHLNGWLEIKKAMGGLQDVSWAAKHFTSLFTGQAVAMEMVMPSAAGTHTSEQEVGDVA